MCSPGSPSVWAPTANTDPAAEDLAEGALQGTSEVIVPLYSPSKDAVRGLDPKNGRELWRVAAEGLAPVAGTPDLLFLTPATNYATSGFFPPAASRITALDTRTGEERWSIALDIVALDVAVGPNAVVVLTGFYGGPPRIKVLSLTDGSVIADAVVERSGVNLHSLFVTSDIVSIAASSGGDPPRTVAYALKTGDVAWATDGIYFGAVGTVGQAEAIFGTRVIPTQDPADRFEPDANLAIDANTGVELWSARSHAGMRGLSSDSVIEVDGEYGYFSVVESISARAAQTGELRWSMSPGKQDVEPYQRRYPKTFTVSTFLGGRSVYVFGGCAVEAPDDY